MIGTDCSYEYLHVCNCHYTFQFCRSGSVQISDLKISGSKSMSSFNLSQCDLGSHNITIFNVEISESQYEDHDGAITAVGPCSVILNEVHFFNNMGRAMVLKKRALGFARNCWFHNNSVASNGAAILVQEQASLTLSESIFINNTANAGASIYMEVWRLLFVDFPLIMIWHALPKCFLWKHVVSLVQC